MKHELKIIMTYDDEVDTRPIINTHNTTVFHDDEAVGLIQSIDLHVDVKSALPQITIIFPDLKDTGSTFELALEKYVDTLSKITNVRVALSDIWKAE